jgi:hypothetical protein
VLALVARRLAAALLAAVCVAALAGCSRYTPSYDRDGNVNGDPVSEMHTFAENLSAGRGVQIILTETVPGFMSSMGHFLKGHLGRPTRVVRINEAGDQLASEHLAIACSPGDVQHIEVLWRWQDGGWRGWPSGMAGPHGTVRDLPPCD